MERLILTVVYIMRFTNSFHQFVSPVRFANSFRFADYTKPYMYIALRHFLDDPAKRRPTRVR